MARQDCAVRCQRQRHIIRRYVDIASTVRDRSWCRARKALTQTGPSQWRTLCSPKPDRSDTLRQKLLAAASIARRGAFEVLAEVPTTSAQCAPAVHANPMN